MAGTPEGGKKAVEKSETSEKASPAAIEKYLHGVDFPAEKNQLLQHAKKNQAPESVLKSIDGLPSKTYNSPIDISKAMGS